MKKVAVVTALAFAMGITSLWAQSTAQIQGTISDPSGSAVPGAEIKARQTETGSVRTAIAGADGGYVLSNLPIGPYRLEVSKSGFSTYVQNGLVLQVATNPTIDISLKVGAVNEQIQVEAAAVQVETEATGVGSVIENQRIVQLPLNGRLVTDLIQLTGAVITQGVAGSGGFPNTAQFVVAGGQAFGDAFWLDGSMFNNPWDNANLPFPFPDAMQEFKVETSALSAQNGVHSGASITAVTKSGTNGFHGDAFEFLRNGDFNARNFFAPTRDTLKRNQFGGTIGGPIKKDKLFFFFGYQATRTRQDPTSTNAFVPTPAMIQGNFSGCPAAEGALTSKFTNGIISPSQFDPASLKLASSLPPSTNPCGQTTFGLVTKINEGQWVFRSDFQINEKHSIFGRFMSTAYNRPASYSLSPGNILSTAQGFLDDRADATVVGDTYLFSPTTVNAFRATWNRVAIGRGNADFFSACDLGVQMYCGYLPHQSYFTVTNSFTVGSSIGSAAQQHNNTYELTDDVTLVRGKHQLTFGGNAANYRLVSYASVYAQNQFTFPSLAAFLLGQFSSNAISGQNDNIQSKYLFALYAHDTWKLTPRLTVNLGLRYEPFIPPQLTNGAIYNFSVPAFYAGQKSTIFNNAPPGLTFPGDPGFLGKSGTVAHWNLWAPRVGLAYDPRGDGKMVVRASYGLAWDYADAQLFTNADDAPPYGGTEIFAASPTVKNPFTNVYASNPGGNIFPYAINANAPFTPFGTFIAVPKNMGVTEVHQWNFVIQKQFGNDWLASATYVGSETEHLVISYQLNPANYIAGNCIAGQYGLTAPGPCSTTGNQNYRRTFSLANAPGSNLIGYMDTFDTSGTSSYNGLILSLAKRLSKGVSANANYTWSHCIGDLVQGNNTTGAGSGLAIPGNRHFDHANCQSAEIGGTFSSDRRQIFNGTIVYEAPKLPNAWARRLLSDWRISAIYRAQSAPWLTVGLSTDISLTADSAANQRPVQVLQDPLCTTRNSSCWINKAAFTNPAPGTLSPMGRDNVPGPSFFQLDAAIVRLFPIREKQTLEFRAEAFNFTNSFRAGISLPSPNAGGAGVVTTFGAANFGQITSALDPRILQLAMKFVF